VRISSAERDREDAAARKAQNGNHAGAAADWVELGKQYANESAEACCYYCESGRAYARAAREYQQAGNAAKAKEAIDNALTSYERCAGSCLEMEEFTCAEVGLSQANVIYERLEREALAADNAAALGQIREKKRKNERAILDLIRLKQELQKAFKKDFGQKTKPH
jgi:hypothetical protein